MSAFFGTSAIIPQISTNDNLFFTFLCHVDSVKRRVERNQVLLFVLSLLRVSSFTKNARNSNATQLCVFMSILTFQGLEKVIKIHRRSRHQYF